MAKSSLYVRRITISAVFLCIALVLKTAFNFYIPLFGQNGMTVGISGIFSMMPSILFGPVYGAIVSGLSDLLGYVIKPTGAYIPWMTLIVAAGGFIRGSLWVVLKKKDSKKMRIIIAVLAAILLVIGISNIICLADDGVNSEFYSQVNKEDINTDNMHLISKLLVIRTMNTKNPASNLATYTTCMEAGIIGSAVFCFILLFADLFICKILKRDTKEAQIPQLLIAMVVSGIITTTLNTIILRETVYAAWKVLPFAVVWIPRIIEEILGNTVKAYFIALLLGVLKKQNSLMELIARK